MPTPEAIARDIRAVGRLSAVPTLLRVLCETTGMGFAAVARVTDETWVACAVADDINFGLAVGGRLDVKTTLCSESRAARKPIVIARASTDPVYKDHHTPKLYNIESYVSVPIVLASGRYFGNLCAIDPHAAAVAEPKVVRMFERFAEIIALQLDVEFNQEVEREALTDERSQRELREQFIAILGHDLRNPLQAVGAAGEILTRRLTDPTLRGIAARIQTSVRRMSGLIDDVLDFARGRLGGGIGVNVAEVAHIELALEAVIKELQDARPERRIDASFQVNRPVWCDVARIQQVASNLVGNALVHGSPDAPVRVTVGTAAEEFVLEVGNEGTPIPADSIKRIFEPFWRQSSAGEGAGLGLGLYICAQIVKAHCGTLTVASSMENGTRFTVRLPLRPATPTL